MKEVLRFERVEMRYHTKTSETVAVKDLSFSVSEGEFLAVVGPSGCGKTTLLSLAAGLLKPSSGKVISSGVTFGYMLQKDELFPWRTIEKNAFLPLEIKKIDNAENRAKVIALAEKYCFSTSRFPRWIIRRASTYATTYTALSEAKKRRRF